MNTVFVYKNYHSNLSCGYILLLSLVLEYWRNLHNNRHELKSDRQKSQGLYCHFKCFAQLFKLDPLFNPNKMGQILAPFPSENDSTILRKLFAKKQKGSAVVQW